MVLSRKDFYKICKVLKKPVLQTCCDIAIYPNFNGYTKCLVSNLSNLLYTAYINRLITEDFDLIKLKDLSDVLFLNTETTVSLDRFEKNLLKFKLRKMTIVELTKCRVFYDSIVERIGQGLICSCVVSRLPIEEFEKIITEEVYKLIGTKFDL